MKTPSWAVPSFRIVVALLLFGSLSGLHAATKLSNLSTAAGGAAQVTASNFKAQPFRTTDVGPFEIASVTLKLNAGTNAGGNFAVAIYSGESAPTALVPNGQLIGESNPIAAGEYAYTASGLTLDPSSQYWIVASVTGGPGSYRWVIAGSNTFAVSEWQKVDSFGQSLDQGLSWRVQTPATPYLFSISNASSGAQTYNGSDDFNDNDLGTIGVNNRWRFNALLSSSGSSAFTNQNSRLEFTATPGGGNNTRVLGWISPSSSGGAYGFDWLATVDVRNAALPSTGFTLAGMEIYKIFADASSNLSNSAYYGVYLFNSDGSNVTGVRAERGIWNPTTSSWVRTTVTVNLPAGGRAALLRLKWSASTRTLEAGYSLNNGQSYTTVRTFAVAGADAGLGPPFANGFGLELTGAADRTTVAAGEITFDNMTVTSSVLPSITTNPVSQSVNAGQAVAFGADVAGSRPLTYQWFRNDVAISGATSLALRLPTASAADAGVYKLTATNSLGSATSAGATLTVSTPLTITTQPTAVTAAVGQSATFTVAASSPGALTYQWRKNGVSIAGATNSTLTINPITAGSFGNYAVLVTSPTGSLESAAAPLVETAVAATAPAITQQPRGATINAGATLALSVSATGTPTLSYQWRANGATIPGATSPTLVLNNAQVADSGVYTVTVSTAAGSVTSDAVVISVGDGFSRQLNISTRGFAGTDSNTLIPAFVISGANSKRLLIRAAGPALAGFGVSGTISDPQLSVVSNNTTLVANNDWSADATNAAAVREAAASVGAFAFADGSRDAAVVATVPPGPTSILVTGTGGATGEAIVEVYDLDAADASRSRLVNLSTRAFVPASGNPLISGFVVQGLVSKAVLIRASGPALTGFGVTGAIAQPRLTIFDSEGRALVTNTGWESSGIANAIISASQSVGAFAHARGSADSAILTTLAPGNYTAQIVGADGTGGVSLVEIYELP